MENKYYVSDEVAHLLKQKGYNQLCDNYYDEDCLLQKPACTNYDFRNMPCLAAAPTKDEVLEWLETEHNIHIEFRMMHVKTKGDPLVINETDEYQWQRYYAICIDDDVDNPVLQEDDDKPGHVKLHVDRLECVNTAIKHVCTCYLLG